MNRDFVKIEGAAITAHVILLALVTGFLVLALFFPLGYIWATYEDLVGEWTQFFLWLSAFSASLALAMDKGASHRCFFAFLAIASAYVAGEEISWGQRIFGFATPSFFMEHNLQQEANLHNLFTGPYATGVKRAIEILLAAALVGYGLVYPWPSSRLDLSNVAARPSLMARSMAGLARWIPAPPSFLGPFFLLAALFELRLFRFNEAEIAEILVAFAVTAIGLQALEVRGRLRSASAMVVVLVGSVLLGCAATGASWMVPHMRVEMLERQEAGMKRFGKRYERYAAWENSASLYRMLLKEDPDNPYLLRRLAECYKRLGEEERFRDLNRKALYVDMMRYARFPTDIKVNLSLYHTYRQAGNEERARYHLERAMREGRDRTMLDPQDARAAYLLGKTYFVAGNYREAVRYLEKAVSMRPGSKLYRKALMRARTVL